MSDRTISYCRIHPGIGVARVGNSATEFFLGPEIPGVPPTPEGGAFKDAAGRIKRQGQRFRIYAYDDQHRVIGEITAKDAKIAWTAHLANTKASWFSFDMALDVPGATTVARRNAQVTGSARLELEINSGIREIAGVKQAGVILSGRFMGRDVTLGELRTDDAGRLLVLGGVGNSGTTTPQNPLSTFANNEGWYDDVSDGPIDATVTIDGKVMPVEGAWLMVAPPDYAPGVPGIVTLYDIMDDATRSPTQREPVEFWRDIFPILLRLNRLQWVNYGFFVEFGWTAQWDFLEPTLLARLADPGATSKELRNVVFNRFRNPSFLESEPQAWPAVYGDAIVLPTPPNNPRQLMAVTRAQYERLHAWARGAFTAAPRERLKERLEEVPTGDQPASLDRAALDACLGGPFHPGCEATWPMRHACVYDGPFRIRRRPKDISPLDYGRSLTPGVAIDPVLGPLSGSGPGDITRWMAVPWQADTSSCLSGYEPFFDEYLPTFWPSRVPNHVLTDAVYREITDPKTPPDRRRVAFFQARDNWLRRLPQPTIPRINAMLTEWDKLGIVVAQSGSVAGLPPEFYIETAAAPIPAGAAAAAHEAAPPTMPALREESPIVINRRANRHG